jgi:ferric-dicitrate binding protein FerR (iron transport regulator)
MDERIYIIVAKQMSGELSQEELRELEAWLSSSAENKAEYEDMQRLWEETDNILQQPTVDTHAAWNKVMAATIQKEQPIFKTESKTVAFPSWVKYAVSAAAILLIALLVWKPMSDKGMVTVAANDANKEVILPVVTLRAGSSLQYPSSFSGSERHVALTGEAFFKVTRDESKPFTIDAASATVRVLGTSFNVDCSNDAATVVVATGKVQMASAKQASKNVILTPGEQGTLQGGELSEAIISDSNYLYWMTGTLNFDKKPLNEVVSTLARIHKTRIKLAPALPENIKNQMITISFNKQSVEDMLTELCMVASCKWTKENNEYIISTPR